MKSLKPSKSTQNLLLVGLFLISTITTIGFIKLKVNKLDQQLISLVGNNNQHEFPQIR